MAQNIVWTGLSKTGLLFAGLALSGCMMPFGNRDADVEATRGASAAPVPALAQIEQKKGQPSELIQRLMARQSVIPQGSAFAAVSQVVLASNARTADAELRAARLRARAQSTNWLPSIGPRISLTSLGDFVAQLVIEQVIFDNGRAKAERDFAAADVEVAAVGLSQDTNDRVSTALNLYIKAERAREEAAVSAEAQTRMKRFVNIIRQRVDGGVSNLADLRVAQSKLQELDAEYIRARESEATSMAELNAMAQLPVFNVRGLANLSANSAGRFPLNVLKAQAEGDRGIAKARIDRAALLPGVTLGGTIGEGGSVGVNTTSDQLISLGTGTALAALEASKDAARRSVAQAQEDNQRVVQRLVQRRISLQRQQGESQALVAEAQTTYTLFYNQFQNSGRPIMDVVNIYENAMRLERDAVRLKYELAEIEVEIAGLYGLLVDGEDV